MLPNANTRAGRVLRLPLKLIPRDTVVTARAGLIEGMKWRAGTSNHGCWLGHYEPFKQRAVRELIRPGMNVIDVGANVGFYTLAFARLCAPGHVWAIEPLARNIPFLLDHIAMNELRNVTVIQAAVSDSQGMAGFTPAPASNSMGKIVGASVLQVPTIRLDDLPRADVVKMDIEGGELAALRGASQMLAARRTTWLVALDRMDDDPERPNQTIREMFTRAGYAITELAEHPGEIMAHSPSPPTLER